MYNARISVICARNIFNKGSIINFGTSSNRFKQVKSIKRVAENNFKSTDYHKASKTFQIVGAGSAAVGVGIISFYGFKQSNETLSIVDKSAVWPQYVRERIQSTYIYFALSNMVTAATAIHVFNSNSTLFRWASRPSIPTALLGLAMLIGSGITARSISSTPQSSNVAKHIAWICHCGILGVVISPVFMMGGVAVQKAAMYTMGIVGGLSAVAISAPSDKFLYMGAPLAMGLGLVFASSIAGMFLNPLSQLGAAALSFQLYGGLALFGGFLLYDTQHVVKDAETYPVAHSDYGSSAFPPYSPINSSMGIYLDTVNIFIRLATIFGMGGTKKR